MSLFTINRYMGEEGGDGDQEDSKKQAQSILHKIHQQAKARRSLSTSIDKGKSPKLKTPTRSSTSDTSSSSSSEDEVQEKKVLKRKRLKEKGSDSEDEVKSKKTPKKTPVKKMKKEVESEQESSSESSSEEESPKKKLKKTQIKTNLVDSTKKKTKQQKATESEHVEKSLKKSKNIQNKSPEKDSPSKLIKKKKTVKEAKVETSSDEESSDEGAEKDPEEEKEEEGEEGGDEEDEKSGPQNREVGGFTVIGDVRKKKVEQVQRVLPDWLANPSVVNNDLKEATDGLQAVHGLEPHLTKKLADNGITHFFPVQRLVIPVLLGGQQTGHLVGTAGYRPSDICCSAPTGSGKTLAFVLPIVQSLQYRVVREVRALVVLPVRDLASQVYKVFTTYTKDTNLKVGLLIGQKSFKNEQQNLVRKGARGLQVQADIVVATPGRLVDHIKDTPGFNLHHLRYLVIDEADRMMDDIKQDWLSQVEAAVYGGHSTRPPPQTLSATNASKLEMPLQKLLFSATLSQNPEKLQQLNLFQPRLFTAAVSATRTTPAATTTGTDAHHDKSSLDVSTTSKTKGDFVGKFTTPAGLTEYLVMARDAGEKPLLVLYFLLHRKFHHVLVFTNSVEATHRLYHLIRLVGGVTVQEFSSSLHAAQRDRTLKKFAAGKIDVLICSDAMARGMDVEGVQCVLSYDHAPYVKTYIHRIGRTARAGKVGTAITLLEKKEVFNFKKMVREAGKEKVRELKISKGDMRGLLPAYQGALQELPAVLQGEKKGH